MREYYQLLSLDVWGNEKDGFDVNDIRETGFFLELNDNGTIQNSVIIAALKRAGFLTKRYRFHIEWFDHSFAAIDHASSGEPCYQLRRLDKDEYLDKSSHRWSFSWALHYENAMIYREDKKGFLRKIG